MTTEERIEKLENRVEKLEKHNYEQDMNELQKYNDLEKLIAKAVEEGISKVLEKFEKLEARVSTLEQAEAQKALKRSVEFWKTVKSVLITTIVTFFASILINNFVAMVTSNTNQKTEEVYQWQNQKELKDQKVSL